MRVIRHESGWDIALDMVFTDKHTAQTIAERIGAALHALVRDAVDASMCGRKTAKDARGERGESVAHGMSPPKKGEVCREENPLQRGDREGAEASRGRSAGGGVDLPGGHFRADPIPLEEAVHRSGD